MIEFSNVIDLDTLKGINTFLDLMDLTQADWNQQLW